MKGPVPRRLVHAGTALLLLLVPAFSWSHLRWALTAGAGLAIVLEVLRLGRPAVGAWLTTRFPMFRSSESHRPSGATFLAVGYAIAGWLPAPVPAAGILVAALADPAAAWIGSRFLSGNRKSWPGTGAAWAIAVLVLLTLGYGWPVAAGAGAVGAALERWNLAWDDNLVIAPGVGLAVLLLA